MIIYTSITNNYCELPEIEDLGHEYICFHDGTVKPKSPWQLRNIKYEHEDPVVLSRHPKILFHEYFDEPCVYVDASRLHQINNKEFFDISEKILNSRDLILMRHPENHNYFEECLEYYLRSWTTETNLVNITKHLNDRNYNFSEHETFLGTILWRTPTDDVVEWCELWWELYQKSNPRDQLPGSAALKLSGIEYQLEYTYPIISQFVLYKDFWKDINGNSGNYSVKKRSKSSWQDVVTKIVDIVKVDYKDCIDPFNLRYLKSIGFREHLQEIENTFNIKDHKNVLENSEENLHRLGMLDQRGGYDFTVYTCITNNYDNIPNENYYDPKVRYVCFHDGTIDTSKGPWEYIDVRDYSDLTCPRRLSAFPKINPHRIFESGTHCVWIDACYIQTEEFIETSRKMFPTTVTTMEHCYDFSYYDEMLEGFLCSFFSYDEGIELTKKLYEAGYNFKEYCSPCCTIIWRTVWDEDDAPEFNKFCDLWWEWSLVGSNRDQVSFDAARQFSGIQINKVYNKPPSTIVAGINLKFDLKNKNRKGKHPRGGNLDQWRRREEFVQEMNSYAAMSPRIYAKHEHITMMDWNGIFDAPGKRSEYTLKSRTIKNFMRQCKLWDENNPIRDKQISFNDYIWHRDVIEAAEMQERIDEVKKKYRKTISRYDYMLVVRKDFLKTLKSSQY